MTETIEDEILRLDSNPFSDGVTLAVRLASPGVRYNDLPGAVKTLSSEIKREIEAEIKYRGYVEMERKAHARITHMESTQIPPDMDFGNIHNLKMEARQKLTRVRPNTLAQASRIPGVTAADIAVLSISIKAHSR